MTSIKCSSIFGVLSSAGATFNGFVRCIESHNYRVGLATSNQVFGRFS
jgi:hypothetical protein